MEETVCIKLTTYDEMISTIVKSKIAISALENVIASSLEIIETIQGIFLKNSFILMYKDLEDTMQYNNFNEFYKLGIRDEEIRNEVKRRLKEMEKENGK